MALIKCPECGKQISDKAVSCPNCGFPLSEIRKEDTVATDTSKYYHVAESTDPLVSSNKTVICSTCGSPIAPGQRFCNRCGTKVIGNEIDNYDGYYTNGNPGVILDLSNPTQQMNQSYGVTRMQPQIQPRTDIVSDKWIWSLATVPVVVGWLVPLVLAHLEITNAYIPIIVVIALNILFLTLDVKVLKLAGLNPDSWLFLGFLLVPIYLFVRESKTNRNCGPGIVWCVLFTLELLA